MLMAWVILIEMRRFNMDKKNICRPITFYNQFIPPLFPKGKWEYNAFGAFDGIKILNKIVGETTGNILEGIWEQQNKFAGELNGQYSSQTIYGICNMEEKKEDEFWKDDSQKPFWFFSRIQLKIDMGDTAQNNNKVSAVFANDDNTESIVYLTYDNSDFLVITKARTYNAGAELINSMHRKFEISDAGKYVKKYQLKNSFTIFAMKQNVIEQMENDEIRKQYNALNKIDWVSIRVMERNCDQMQKYIMDVNEQLVNMHFDTAGMQPILGIDDGMFIIKNVPWGDFLKLYCRETKIFSSKKIAGITTSICVKINEDVENVGSENQGEPTNKSKENIYQEYVNYLYGQLKDLQTQEEGVSKIQYKELNVILNGLAKFSGEVFSDYLFFSLLKPLDMLLYLLSQKGKIDSYYEFIKIFNVYAQNSTKSDRNSMQSMDFNAKIYDIPCKLNAFYTAIIYMARDILNASDSEQKYEFLVIPSVTNIVSVKELFQKVSTQKRLICVEVPENRFYDVGDVLIIFMHEAAHYVGTTIRRRDERYKNLLLSIASTYIEYVKSYWKDERQQDIQNVVIDWDGLKERMFLVLKAMLEREQNEIFLMEYQFAKEEVGKEKIKKIKDNNVNYKTYISFLKQNLYRALMDITQKALPNVFQKMQSELKLEESDIYEYLESISEQYLVRYTEGTTKMTADTVLDQLVTIYEECFADIMSISILQMTAKDYLDSIIISVIQQGMTIKECCLSSNIYRIMLVCDVMYWTGKQDAWINDIYEKDENLDGRLQIMKYINNIHGIIKNGWENVLEPDKYRQNCFYALLNKDIYIYAREYMIECRKTFMKQCEAENKHKMCETLSHFYREERKNKNNIENQMKTMESIIYIYRNRVYSDLERELKKK